MGCCGDRRADLSRANTPRSRPYVHPVEVAPTLSKLTYRGPFPMVLRGPGSTRIYRLSAPDEPVEVDPLDVAALLRTGWFVES